MVAVDPLAAGRRIAGLLASMRPWTQGATMTVSARLPTPSASDRHEYSGADAEQSRKRFNMLAIHFAFAGQDLGHG
jgi:hypothetical protein